LDATTLLFLRGFQPTLYKLLIKLNSTNELCTYVYLTARLRTEFLINCMPQPNAENPKAFPDVNTWLAAMNASEAVHADMLSNSQAVEIVKEKIKEVKNG